jgi:hypothetical protein
MQSWLARVFVGRKAQVYRMRFWRFRSSWVFNGGAAAIDDSPSEALKKAQQRLDRRARQ